MARTVMARRSALVSFALVVGRWISGRPLDGERRTDATFFGGGMAALSKSAYVTRVDFWPGWHRLALLRLGPVLAFVWLAWHLVTDRAGTLATLHRLAVFGVLVAVVLAVRGLRRSRLHRHVVRPLSLAVGHLLGYDHTVPHSRWLRVPRGLVAVPSLPGAAWWQARVPVMAAALDAGRAAGAWWSPAWTACRWVWSGWVELADWWAGLTEGYRAWRHGRMAVRIEVPHELGSVPAEVRKAVTASAEVKLGGSWTSEWSLRGAHPALFLRPRPEAPSRVTFEQFRPFLEVAPPAALALGLRAGLALTTVDLDGDSPHVMLSMGSGAGKSVLIRLIAAQALARGWAVVLLDFKQDHYWCADLIDEGVPGLVYIRKIPDIHDALIKLEAIRSWRSDVDFEYRGNKEMQRVIILAEEMNATVNQLRTFWQATREKGDPAKSPALTALGQLSAAGRSARMNLFMVGQYLTAQVFGGPEARENFGSRILGRFTGNAWRTLVPEYGPPPPRSSVRGRVQVCQGGGSPLETQVAYLEHEQVREFATSGLAGVVPAGVLPFAWELPEGLPEGLPDGLAEALPAGGTPELPAAADGPGEALQGRPGGRHLSLVSAPVSGPASGPGWRSELPGEAQGAGADRGAPDRRTLAEWCRSGVLGDLQPAAAEKRRQRQIARGTCTLPGGRNVYTRAEVLAWVGADPEAGQPAAELPAEPEADPEPEVPAELPAAAVPEVGPPRRPSPYR